ALLRGATRTRRIQRFGRGTICISKRYTFRGRLDSRIRGMQRRGDRRQHRTSVPLDVLQKIRHQFQRRKPLCESVPQRPLAQLQVALVSRRQGQQLLDLHPRGGYRGITCPHQFHHVRVAFVGHDGTAGGVLIRQTHEIEFGGREQGQIPCQTTQIQQCRGQSVQRRQLEL